MLKYCGIIFIPFALASVYNGECSNILPAGDTGDPVVVENLNGTIWKPIRHQPLNILRFNVFDSSPYLILDCVEFHFRYVDAFMGLDILPTNCTEHDGGYSEDSCWLEHFNVYKFDKFDNRSDISFMASLSSSPGSCARPDTEVYLMTPDFEQILVMWTCFDFNNGSLAEGIWILARKNVEVDFKTLRKARKMINSQVPLEMWIQPRKTLDLCTCQTRFGAVPCTTDAECVKMTLNDFFGASIIPLASPGFLVWFFIGVLTFAVGTIAFIRLSGISDCLCNESYNAF